MQNSEYLNAREEIHDIRYREFLNSDIRALPQWQKPRERLINFGAHTLLDQELLAIILNNGIKNKHIGILADELLERLEQTKEKLTVDTLRSLGGLGIAKASTIMAVLEFGRRFWGISGRKILYPRDIFDVVKHYANRKQERFLSISLNGAHEVIAVRVVTVGLVNRTIVHPREVFAEPLIDRCAAICVCHNHPSGELFPSAEDDNVTSSLEAAAEILGIRFLDHLIFSEKGFYSYRKENKLNKNEKSAWFHACNDKFC